MIIFVAIAPGVCTEVGTLHLECTPHYMIAFIITKSQPTLHVWTQTTACANEYQFLWHLKVAHPRSMNKHDTYQSGLSWKDMMPPLDGTWSSA